MQSTTAVLAFAALLASGALTLTACEHKGPMQRAGEKVDKKTEDLKDKVDPKGPAEKAGRKVDKAVGND